MPSLQLQEGYSMNTKLRAITVLFFGATLIACSHFEPPQQSASAKRIECENLRRQMLFVEANNNNTSHWNVQKQREQLQREYRNKQCYDVLHQEKTT